MSGDREQEYFSDGITDDLITDLSRLEGLFVIARDSSFTYKGKPTKLQEVGKELGVRYVLEGSVRKAAGKVRITVQLADASTGTELWAEHYDRPLRDVFALQDEIVRRIVTTLDLQIALSQQGAGVIPRRTKNLEAYDDVLRGTEYQVSLTKEGNAKARPLFERAIELDPGYAFAYVSLAVNYLNGHAFAFDPDSHVLERALQTAQRAVALDDSFAAAHAVLAFVHQAQSEFDAAVSEAERAIAVGPNSPEGYWALGENLNAQGKPVEALAALETAMRLDPRNTFTHLALKGQAQLELGQWREAITALRGSLGRYPDNLWSHALLAIALYNVGDHDAARAETARVERLAARTPRAVVGYSALVLTLHDQGKPVEALAVAEKGLPFVSQDWQLLFFSGAIYHELGRWEESLAALKRLPPDSLNYVWNHVLMAYAYDALGLTGEAQAEATEVQRAVGRNPETVGGYRALALALLSQRKDPEALTALEKGMRLEPGRRVDYLWDEGVTYARLGRWEKAISALKAYSAHYPDQVMPHAELAIGYTEVGREEAARAEMAEALRLYPRLSLPDGLNLLHMDKERLAADLRRAGLK
jgi:TolB-like protein/predicted Zn-dependent protease